MPVPRPVADLHARFCGAITHRYFIRAHMSAMLLLVLLSGTLASRLLLHAGVASMAVRYPLAVLLSYGVFFGLVRLWLAYVCRAAASRDRRGGRSSDASDVFDDLGGSGSGSGGSGGGGGRLFGGGGGSGGGGSSGAWGDADVAGARPAVPMPLQAQASTGSGGNGGSAISRFFGKSSGGGGGGGDGDGLLLLILFALLVAAILGAGAYMVIQAPVILSEAAFQAVLAGGLVKATRGSHDPGWAGSVFKATVIPFGIVLVLAGVFGYQAHKHCPAARTAHEAMSNCVFH
jgi:hypothetical protein